MTPTLTMVFPSTPTKICLPVSKEALGPLLVLSAVATASVPLDQDLSNTTTIPIVSSRSQVSRLWAEEGQPVWGKYNSEGMHDTAGQGISGQI